MVINEELMNQKRLQRKLDVMGGYAMAMAMGIPMAIVIAIDITNAIALEICSCPRVKHRLV